MTEPEGERLWSADTFIDAPDPNEVSCEQYLSLWDLHPDLIGGSKMEYYAGKVRIGGFPFYDFVKGYLALRGETVHPVTCDSCGGELVPHRDTKGHRWLACEHATMAPP